MRSFALLTILVLIVRGHNVDNVCDSNVCGCWNGEHPHWRVVNCSMQMEQTLQLTPTDLPRTTSDLIIAGAEGVTFTQNSLSRLTDARKVIVTDTGLVVFDSSTAYKITVINLYIDIIRCNILRIGAKAFHKIRGPLSVSIRKCNYVYIDREAFSWVLTLEIADVYSLIVSPGAFVLDSSATNVGAHGPGMSVELRNLSLPDLPKNVFGASAAKILMHSIHVGTVKTDAFSANTYNIVIAINSTFNIIEKEAFSQKSLINNLLIENCKIHYMAERALKSGVTNLTISHSRLEIIDSGAINATVASATMLENIIVTVHEKAIELSSWNTIHIEGNMFETLSSFAIIAAVTSMHADITFSDNQVDKILPSSLDFLGQAYEKNQIRILFVRNYFGDHCSCDAMTKLTAAFNMKTNEVIELESHCALNEFFTQCFNIPEKNMRVRDFVNRVCGPTHDIKCISGRVTEPTEFINTRFPHKNNESEPLSDRDKKIIGVVIVVAVSCVVILMIITLIRWMRRRGYCTFLKNLCTSITCCCICYRIRRLFRFNDRPETNLSVSSANDISDRLIEPRFQDLMMRLNDIPDYDSGEIVPTEEKATQTLPEELTKELLEKLKANLDDPHNYTEAREMIEHLYELIKVEDSCNTNSPQALRAQENIYELPFENTAPRIGRNQKEMKSVGTRTPSLDKLVPVSPYNRETGLVHEYFEPRDLAVHLYAEIVNYDRCKNKRLGDIPDLVAEQPKPRGPFLQAICEKKAKSNKKPSSSKSRVHDVETIKLSDSTIKMKNRPLPEKPAQVDPGEGTSVTQF